MRRGNFNKVSCHVRAGQAREHHRSNSVLMLAHFLVSSLSACLCLVPIIRLPVQVGYQAVMSMWESSAGEKSARPKASSREAQK